MSNTGCHHYPQPWQTARKGTEKFQKRVAWRETETERVRQTQNVLNTHRREQVRRRETHRENTTNKNNYILAHSSLVFLHSGYVKVGGGIWSRCCNLLYLPRSGMHIINERHQGDQSIILYNVTWLITEETPSQLHIPFSLIHMLNLNLYRYRVLYLSIRIGRIQSKKRRADRMGIAIWDHAFVSICHRSHFRL